jgi:ATP-dependent protease ClpP protease subunit
MGVEPSKYLEIRDQTDNADTLMKIIKDIYLENTKLSNEKLDELLMHDWWLNSTLSKQYGIVDIII